MPQLPFRRESDEAPKTAMGRTLYTLDDGDGIGIIDAVSQALEQLETEEAVEAARIGDGINSENFASRQSIGPQSDVYGGSPDADPGPDVSHELMTARQVELALSANKSAQRAASGEATQTDFPPAEYLPADGESSKIDGGPKQPLPLGLRRRRRAPPGNSTENKGPTGVALFGTEAMVPFSKGISNYFATVGSTQEKRVVALSAWGISVIGLLVCLVFVTKDFVSSKNEAMVAVQYSLEEEVRLPTMFLCSTQMTMPFAWDQAKSGSNFLGRPTTWVESMRMPGTDSTIISYPQTQSHENIEAVTIDRFGAECTSQSLKSADAVAFNAAILDQPRCFHCVKVKSDPPVMISRKLANAKAGGDFTDATLVVKVAHMKIVDECRRARAGISLSTKEVLIGLILEHAMELEKREVVDFSGVDPSERNPHFGNEEEYRCV